MGVAEAGGSRRSHDQTALETTSAVFLLGRYLLQLSVGRGLASRLIRNFAPPKQFIYFSLAVLTVFPLHPSGNRATRCGGTAEGSLV